MDFPKEALDASSLKSFNIMQETALNKGVVGKNAVISAPTASGKTLLAEICSLESIISRGKKVIYTCPLKALAFEQFNGFKDKYSEKHKIKATVSTGDFDSGGKYLQNYDIIFTTYEKLDSLLRHQADWLARLGLLVVDEIHEIDSGRGPTLEMVITKLRMVNPSLVILGLSATIPNAGELAEWLDAKLVESDFRPVELKEGVFFNSEIHFENKKEIVDEKGEPVEDICYDTLAKEKQALVFANTRKRAESIAKKVSKLTEPTLTGKEKVSLEAASKKILSALERPTGQCRSLAALIAKGAAFHHAGLMQKQRTIVEDLFRDYKIKVISATPTLAAGINMPAYRVVIPSLYRYEMGGMQRIPVRDYKQYCGRAGRPQYDALGESVVISRSEMEKDEIFENYINGDLEEITSKLGIESILRTHLLAAIATNFIHDLDSLEKFFSATFYAKQYGNTAQIFETLTGLLEELKEMGFVEGCQEKKFSATRLGRRVSELYLDPASAHSMIKALEKYNHKDLAYLYTIVNTSEFFPYCTVPKGKESELWEGMQLEKAAIPVNVDINMYTDPRIVQKFHTALMLRDWINEISEESIMKDFNIMPGILHSKLRIADWLLYASFELSRILDLDEQLPYLGKMRKRMKHGIKEELVFLTEIRHIGRARARKLFKAGIKTIANVKKTDVKDLARILSPKIAEKIKQQLGS